MTTIDERAFAGAMAAIHSAEIKSVTEISVRLILKDYLGRLPAPEPAKVDESAVVKAMHEIMKEGRIGRQERSKWPYAPDTLKACLFMHGWLQEDMRIRLIRSDYTYAATQPDAEKWRGSTQASERYTPHPVPTRNGYLETYSINTPRHHHKIEVHGDEKLRDRIAYLLNRMGDGK